MKISTTDSLTKSKILPPGIRIHLSVTNHGDCDYKLSLIFVCLWGKSPEESRDANVNSTTLKFIMFHNEY